jgi:hypothetical protein
MQQATADDRRWTAYRLSKTPLASELGDTLCQPLSLQEFSWMQATVDDCRQAEPARQSIRHERLEVVLRKESRSWSTSKWQSTSFQRTTSEALASKNRVFSNNNS